MQKLVIIGTIVALTAAHKYPINSQIVNTIRQRTSRWVAHDPETNPLRNLDIETIKGMMGTILDDPANAEDLPVPITPTTIISTDQQWDWREKGDCVHPVRD